MDLAVTLTADQWLTLGKVLRQVHELPPARINTKTYKARRSIHPNGKRLFELVYTHIENEPRGDEIALKLIEFMKEHKASICRLVDRAEHFAQKIKKQST